MRSTALLYNCSSIAGNLEKGIQDNHRKQAQWTGWCCSRQGSRGSTSGRRPGGNSRSRVNRIRGSLVENNDVCRTHSTVVLDDEDRNNDVSAPSGRSRDARARRADRPACPADWASAALQVGGANHPPPPPAHSAGLRNPLPVKWVHPAAEAAPEPGYFLQALLSKNGKLRTEPGARTSYSNLGALILAAAMTARSGESFESLMQTNILDPLGMSTTGFGEVRGADKATGYHPRRNPLRYFLPGWVVGEASGRWLALNPFAVDGPPYGGLVGTADNAARFLQMHVADGSFNGEQILRPEVATEMRRITMKGKRYDLGLGWFRPARQRNSIPDFVEHLGGGAGFFNCMRVYPTEGVGAIVIGNATKYDIDAVAELALDFRS
jgi:Beta-lactamase